MPKSAIGYDIEPHDKRIIKADYLKQDIPYMENSLVIGNPPFGESGLLHTEFIKQSIKHSDYIAFVLPGDMYKQDKFENIELYKSYMLPAVKYSGVKLKCCFNIYKKRLIPLKEKKLKNIEVLIFSKRSKNAPKSEEQDWLNIKADYRMVGFGSIRLIPNATKKVYVKEIKIVMKEKVNLKPLLEKYLESRKNVAVAAPSISKTMIEELIWDNYPNFRL